MDKRTLQQNRALHRFFKLLASDLRDAGLDMKKTLKPGADIPWTPEMVKEHLWKPMEKAMFEKESTTELTTKEVNQVYEVLIRHMGEKFSITTPFPSMEDKEN